MNKREEIRTTSCGLPAGNDPAAIPPVAATTTTTIANTIANTIAVTLIPLELSDESNAPTFPVFKGDGLVWGWQGDV